MKEGEKEERKEGRKDINYQESYEGKMKSQNEI